LKSKASSVFSTPCRQAVYIGCKQGAKEKNKINPNLHSGAK
jgi:predicted RNase H-like nuclease